MAEVGTGVSIQNLSPPQHLYRSPKRPIPKPITWHSKGTIRSLFAYQVQSYPRACVGTIPRGTTVLPLLTAVFAISCLRTVVYLPTMDSA